MYLIQFYLPVYDNDGRAFGRARFDDVRSELTEHFGGVTAYVRTPAVGDWEDADGDRRRDEVVLFEVVAPAFDRRWWNEYRGALERRFAQEAIMLRAWPVETL
ncbi:MAG: hypothetical protein ACOY9B_00835 [Pseudomonadota bacterium]